MDPAPNKQQTMGIAETVVQKQSRSGNPLCRQVLLQPGVRFVLRLTGPLPLVSASNTHANNTANGGVKPC